MTAIITLVIIAACAAYQYLKGTFFRSAITILTVISASIVAFAFFEKLAGLMISRGSSDSAMMGYWQPLAFAVLFIFSFAVLQAIAVKLARKSIAADPLVEKIGRVVCAAVYGLLLSGVLLTALDMAPLKNLPYKRFQYPNADPDRPAKAALNTDGLVAGIFGIVSRGSLSGQASFTSLHPSFINELYLNRLAGDISLVTSDNAIEVPAKAAAWLAPQEIKDAENNPVNPKPGYDLTVVRVGIKNSVQDFTLSQIRLICNQKDTEPLEGSAVDAYPIGYFTQADKIAIKKLGEKISTSSGKTRNRVKWIDLVFNVPNNHAPAFVAFKNNNIVFVPKLINTEEAPAPEPF